jgi:TRAP-type transport system small permease protein
MTAISFTRCIDTLERSINVINNILLHACMSMLFILMLLGAVDVFARYLFTRPIIGTLEISECLLPAIVLLAAAGTLSSGEHVTVDLLHKRFSPRMQAKIGFIISLLLLCLFAVATWQGVVNMLVNMKLHRTVPNIRLPISIPQVFAPIGTFSLCLVLAVQMLRHLIKIMKGE